MTIDGPPSTTSQPTHAALATPETLRQAIGGVRQALLGIELTLIAGLVVLVFGTMDLAGLGAAVLGGVGLILVVTGAVARTGERRPARTSGAGAPEADARSS